jgi:hypothetical protein
MQKTRRFQPIKSRFKQLFCAFKRKKTPFKSFKTPFIRPVFFVVLLMRKNLNLLLFLMLVAVMSSVA